MRISCFKPTKPWPRMAEPGRGNLVLTPYPSPSISWERGREDILLPTSVGRRAGDEGEYKRMKGSRSGTMTSGVDLAELAGEFLVRAMQPEDIPVVMEIDQEAFPNPWPESTYLYELRKNPTSHLMVIQSRETGRIVGVAGYWLVVDEAHLSTFAVHPAWRKRGVGKVLLAAILRHAAGLGAVSAQLEVRSGNSAAQALYAGFGFRAVGMRRGYYKDNGENAVLMTAERIDGSGAPPHPEDVP